MTELERLECVSVQRDKKRKKQEEWPVNSEPESACLRDKRPRTRCLMCRQQKELIYHKKCEDCRWRLVTIRVTTKRMAISRKERRLKRCQTTGS